jgi:putative addiction module component (TIGR02574 family)
MNTSEITKLSVSERLRVMEAIWSSLRDSNDQDALMPAWHTQEIDQRLARIEAGQEPMMPLSQAKVLLAQEIASRRADAHR